MSNKKISIICATFNAGKTVEAAVRSILAQKDDLVEFIVIDGSSTDTTCCILDKYKNQLDYFISEPDAGIYDAWNKGLDHATGEYISFIGADDELADGAIRLYMEYVKGDAKYDVVSSRAAPIGSLDKNPVGKGWTWNEFKKHMCISHVGALHHKSLFQRFGRFNPSYKIAGDYEFLLRAGPALNAAFINKVTVRVGVNGLSNTNIKRVLRETRRAKIENDAAGVLRASVDMLVAFLKFYLRRFLKFN